jgi:hypothetical protein
LRRLLKYQFILRGVEEAFPIKSKGPFWTATRALTLSEFDVGKAHSSLDECLFKTSSGHHLTWSHFNKIFNHSQQEEHSQHISVETHIYLSGEQPNRKGLSEWHSCIAVVISEGRMILREENRLSMFGDNHKTAKYDLEFCPHYHSDWYEDIFLSFTRSKAKSACRDIVEGTWKCDKCRIEINILRDFKQEKHCRLFIWRYVDLGDMTNPDLLQWKRLTQGRKICVWSTLNDGPQEVRDVYGPIMRKWTEKLGVVYHFDRHVIPWLWRDEEKAKSQSWE